jgi:hypothetical protein
MDGSHREDTCNDGLVQASIGAHGSHGPLSVVSVLMHPDDVISDLQLTQAKKREILASWASDARSVQNMPALRQLDNGAIVRIDDVLRALISLDDSEGLGQRLQRRSLDQCHRGRFPSWSRVTLRRSRSKDDDDDDPPPCPAVIARPPAGPLSGGEIVDPILAMAA